VKVNVAQLKRNPGAQMDIRLEGSPPSLKKDIAPEATLTSPLTVRLNLSNTGTVIVVKGTLQAQVLLNCSRCLREFTLNLNVSLDETFRQEGAGAGMEMDEEYGIIPFSGDIIDFTTVIRDNLLAALPMKALCQENCRGLCPYCGQDLNETVCHCRKPVGDPRLAVLGKLLEKNRDK